MVLTYENKISLVQPNEKLTLHRLGKWLFMAVVLVMAVMNYVLLTVIWLL